MATNTTQPDLILVERHSLIVGAVVGFLLASICVAGGCVSEDVSWLHPIGAIGFSWISFACVQDLAKRRCHLHLTTDDFTIRDSIQSTSVRWADVLRFEIQEFAGNKYVAFKFTRRYQDECPKRGAFAGCDQGSFPCNYGLKPGKLLRVVTSWHDCYLWERRQLREGIQSHVPTSALPTDEHVHVNP